MRTYLAVATLATLAATTACGTAATRHAVAPVDPAAHSAGIAGDAPRDEPGRSATRPAAYHPSETHDHAGHDHEHAEPAVEPPPFDTGRVTTPRKTPRWVDYGRWHTPEAAMRYLARAYTRHDDVALRHVTNPAARDMLVAMRDYAPDLRLVRCVDNDWGSYVCTFSHAIKGSTKRGSAELQANPALKPGWYATALLGCGDGESA
ncbi:MAG TPA: hypothetical protein VF519_17055 [Mycobacteriales bacterium]|jgi:hypothetical protein